MLSLKRLTLATTGNEPLVTILVELASDEHINMGTAAVTGIEMEIVQAHCGRVILQETVRLG